MKSSGGDKRDTHRTKEERGVGQSRRESKKKGELKDGVFWFEKKGEENRSKQKVEKCRVQF